VIKVGEESNSCETETEEVIRIHSSGMVSDVACHCFQTNLLSTTWK
jgi:hypothetical protein